jgi:hypothetical protein
MARGPYKFKQRDITRAHKGAEAAGKVVVKTEITRDGSIMLWHANDNVRHAGETDDKSERVWDEVYAPAAKIH